jgi:hypothetical protein
MRLCVLGLAAVVACRGTPPPPAQPAEAVPAPGVADTAARDPAPLDQDLPRLVLRSLAMYQDIAQALATSGEDCAAAATRLGQLARRYRDVALANAKVLHDGRAKQLKAALAPHSDAFDDAARRVVQSPTMSTCARDPAFASTFDALLSPPP